MSPSAESAEGDRFSPYSDKAGTAASTMLRVTTILLVAIVLFPFAAGSSIAQRAHTEDGSPVRICGAQLFRTVDARSAAAATAGDRPELYRQMLHERSDRATRLLGDNAAATFWALDSSMTGFRSVTAVRVHASPVVRVWVDVRDTGRTLVKTRIPQIIAALEVSTSAASRDSSKGILENVEEVFGRVPRQLGDTAVDILLLDIGSPYVAGYFSPYDQTEEDFSNRRNMLYVDSRDFLSNLNSLLNTIAHEFQHLVHFARNPNAVLFVNEGASEVAGLLCGYPSRTNEYYLRSTNVDLFSFPQDADGLEAAYERAYTCMWYLYEQFGEGFLGALADPSGIDMSTVEHAMQIARPDNDSARWNIVGPWFGIANYLQASSDAHLGFRRSLTTRMQPRARVSKSYAAGLLPTNDTVVVRRYANAYVQYDRPGVFVVNFKGRYRIGATVLGYTGTAVDVIQCEAGRDYTIGSGTGYDRVIVVINELQNAPQTVTWKIRTVASTGDALADDIADFGFDSVSPNPMNEGATVSFNVGSGGAVRMDLYDLTGRLVRNLLGSAYLAPGRHSIRLESTGLPSGTYLLRLQQDGRAIARVVSK